MKFGQPSHPRLLVYLLLVVFNGLFTPNGFAQSISSKYLITKKSISTDDGLSSREVFCGVQDRDGFMWFGTSNGLNRYDGKSFLLFTKQRNGLRQNKIVHIAMDDSEQLFIQYALSGNTLITSGEVDVINLATHKSEPIGEVLKNMPFREKDIIRISNDGTSEVVFVTESPYRVWRYSSKNGFRLQFEVKEEIQEVLNQMPIRENIRQGSLFQDGKVLVKISNQVFYSVGKEKARKVELPATSVFSALCLTKNGEALVMSRSETASSNYRLGNVTTNGKVNYNANPNSFGQYPIMNRAWRNIVSTIGDRSGLLSDPAQGMYLWRDSTLFPLFSAGEIKGFTMVFSSFVDTQGNYWICTSEGVIQLKVSRNHFQQTFNKDQFTALHYNSTRGIYADETGRIFAGVGSSLCMMDRTGLLKTTNVQGMVYALQPVNNRLMVSALSLHFYNDFKNQLVPFQNLKTEKPFYRGEIWSLFSFSENSIWAGCRDRILMYDLARGTESDAIYASRGLPKPKFVYRFFKENEDKIWAVSSNGLHVLDQNGTIVDYYGTTSDSSHRLPIKDLNDVYDDGNGIFWLATNEEGLWQWNRKTHTFRQFTVSEGLPSNILYRIESDENHNLWISSDNGLVRFNTQTFTTNRYSVKDGLSDNELNRVSSFKAANGQLFFGGLNGVNSFYPNDFQEDTVSFRAPLRVISFSQFSGSQDKIANKTNDLLASNQITLEPGDKFFTMEFQLLDFSQSGVNRYAYKIDGLDKDWNYIHENSIRMSGLNHGNYVLHIKGQNNKGAWTKSELNIQLIVLKPFYKEWWFILFLIVGFIFLGYVFFHWRTIRLRKEKDFLEKTVNSRTEELQETLSEKETLLKEIHHRVKNNLQVISALLEMQGSRTTDEKTKAAIMESQNRVLSIAFIHQNLYQHEDIKSVEVQSFVNELVQHIQHVFGMPGREVNVQNHIPSTFLDIDTAVPLGLIINELLTNSFKYAFVNRNEGHITLNLKSGLPGEYDFEYSDDGLGLPAEIDLQKSNSLGLKLVRQLCKQLAGKLVYRYENGSRFSFTLKDLETRNKIS